MHFGNMGWQISFLRHENKVRITSTVISTNSITVYDSEIDGIFHAYHCICHTGICAYHMLHVGGREEICIIHVVPYR